MATHKARALRAAAGIVVATTALTGLTATGSFAGGRMPHGATTSAAVHTGGKMAHGATTSGAVITGGRMPYGATSAAVAGDVVVTKVPVLAVVRLLANAGYLSSCIKATQAGYPAFVRWYNALPAGLRYRIDQLNPGTVYQLWVELSRYFRVYYP